MPRETLQSLTETMYYVLLVLKKNKLCGTEIMAKVSELSGGRILLGPGTLYTMLSKFEENEIIQLFDNREEFSKKKTYVITEKGQYYLSREYTRVKTLYADGKKIMEDEENE